MFMIIDRLQRAHWLTGICTTNVCVYVCVNRAETEWRLVGATPGEGRSLSAVLVAARTSLVRVINERMLPVDCRARTERRRCHLNTRILSCRCRTRSS